MTLKKFSNFGFFVTAFSLIMLDQITKILVKGFHLFGIIHQGMDYGQSIPIIGDFLQLTYIENSGMAFGITFGAGKIFLSLFSIFASIGLGIILYRLRHDKFLVKLGFAFILAGAIGNLIDRVFYGVFYGEMPLFYGRVVDFVQVDIPDIDFWGIFYTHFPVFNVADSCVTVGVSFLIIAHKYIPNIYEVLFPKKVKEIEPIESEPTPGTIDHKQDNSVES